MKVKTIALEDYPALLYTLGMKVLELESDLYQKRLDLESLNGEHESAVAFDEVLKNDLQRKAAVKKLRQEQTYLGVLAAVRDAEMKLKEAELLREQRLNEFDIAKSAKRYQIVNLELQRRID